MNHVKNLPFPTLHFPEDKETSEEESEEGPAAALAVEEEDVVGGVGEPGCGDAEDVVEKGEREEGATLVLFRVVEYSGVEVA